MPVRLVAFLLAVAGCGRLGFEVRSDGRLSGDGTNPLVDGSLNGDGAVPAGLVAWWKFDDGTGSVALDASGHGNTATLIGGPVWGTGPSGGDLTFNGVDQEADSMQNVPVGEALSISFRVSTTSTNEGHVFVLGLYASCELSFSPGIVACSPDGMIQLQGSLASDGQWHVVTYVSAGASAAQTLYVDGVVQMSMSGTVDETRGTAVCIASGCGQYFANASLQDVRVYDVALDASQVAAL